MGKKNNSNLEDEIKSIIQNAINTKDFYQLNHAIEHTVKGALDEVKSALKDNRDILSASLSSHKNRIHRRSARRSKEYSSQSNTSFNTTDTVKNKALSSYNNTCYPSSPVGKVSGVLFTVFGWILLGTMGLTDVILLMIGLLMGQLPFLATIAIGLLPFILAGFLMTMKGASIRHRLRRFKRYQTLIGNHSYYSLNDLSAHTRFNKKYMLKDLRKMISIGMFPEGHIDKQETCIMLNKESFQQYLELQNHQRTQYMADNNSTVKSSKNSPISEKSNASEKPDPALQQAVESGQACIRQLREANSAIPGVEISQKLTRLEVVIDKIFGYVALHPEQLLEIQKFMDYYLPTTLKLVNAYKEFTHQPVQGENITTAKNEIENTLDTINHAFETLLDSLFEDAAMDVSTDISVLETMLAQEGLTRNTFKQNETFGGKENE